MGIPRGHCRLACLSTMPMELMPAHRKGFLETLVHGILQQFQRFQKWRTPQTDLQPGNIVVVREDAWPLARITGGRTAGCGSPDSKLQTQSSNV